MRQLELFELESELARRIRKVEEEIERQPEWVKNSSIWQGGANIRENEHYIKGEYSSVCGIDYE